MRTGLTELKSASRELSEYRRTCTGEALDISAVEALPTAVLTAEEFDSVVTSSYMLWRETWKIDVGFLAGPRRTGGPTWDFDELINDLRTAAQHSDNSAAKTRRMKWLNDVCGGRSPSTDEDWTSCAVALLGEFAAAVRYLSKRAAARRTDPQFRRDWQDRISASVESIVRRVADDLGMYLNPSSFGYHVRQVERRMSSNRPRRGETMTEMLASFAERSLISGIQALPCKYEEILDALEVLASPDAVPALHLAHAVAEISRTAGDAFLDLVEATWDYLRAAALLWRQSVIGQVHSSGCRTKGADAYSTPISRALVQNTLDVAVPEPWPGLCNRLSYASAQRPLIGMCGRLCVPAGR